jgi:F-type H+-transporting ATPase subunit epsilon
MATNDTLHVEVVTAERSLYSGEADMVEAQGTLGQMGILPHHAALLTTLSPGALEVRLNGAEETFFVSGGFLEVSNNKVTVLADTAEQAESIDEARAEEARRRAEERMSEARSNSDRAEAQAALQRAMNRLKVAGIVRRSNRNRIDRARSQQDY